MNIKDIYNKLHTDFKYEKRENQIKMSEFIDEGLFEKRQTLIEAETGSGKTLAYLIPLILRSINNNVNVVISTNTINLQEQILKQELPLIEKLLGVKLNYTLIKGRTNYVCRRKLDEFYLKNSKNEELKNILEDIEISKTGDRADIKNKDIFKIWNEIKSEKETTLSVKCPYYDKCYYYNTKKNDEFNIFIVNHNILILDSILRAENDVSLIPEYDSVVIDEAHNLENIARVCYTKEFSFREINKYLGQLYNRNAKTIDKSGNMLRLLEKLPRLKMFENQIISSLDNIYDNTFIIMKKLIKIYPQIPSNGVRADKIYDLNVNDQISNIKSSVKFLDLILKEMWKIIKDDIKASKDKEVERSYQLIKNYFKYIKDKIAVLNSFFAFDLKNNIYWLNYSDNVFITLNITPYNISKLFSSGFISKRLVLTSATLTVNGSFDYLENSLGLEDVSSKIVESTFNYKDNMNIYLPSDISLPDNFSFKQEISDFIYNYIVKNEGKTFVLFTSYTDLNYVYDYILKKDHNLTVLRQGDYERSQLLEKFKKLENTVLLGTDSFWEGVDVKGEKLSSVIISKIPFQVPDNPIVKSISEMLGNKSFTEYQLPYATIKMKQGVGRLIRDKDDRGNIIILDKRMYSKGYGKMIMKSLPKGNIEILSLAEILLK